MFLLALLGTLRPAALAPQAAIADPYAGPRERMHYGRVSADFAWRNDAGNARRMARALGAPRFAQRGNAGIRAGAQNPSLAGLLGRQFGLAGLGQAGRVFVSAMLPLWTASLRKKRLVLRSNCEEKQ